MEKYSSGATFTTRKSVAVRQRRLQRCTIHVGLVRRKWKFIQGVVSRTSLELHSRQKTCRTRLISLYKMLDSLKNLIVGVLGLACMCRASTNWAPNLPAVQGPRGQVQTLSARLPKVARPSKHNHNERKNITFCASFASLGVCIWCKVQLITIEKEASHEGIPLARQIGHEK